MPWPTTATASSPIPIPGSVTVSGCTTASRRGAPGSRRDEPRGDDDRHLPPVEAIHDADAGAQPRADHRLAFGGARAVQPLPESDDEQLLALKRNGGVRSWWRSTVREVRARDDAVTRSHRTIGALRPVRPGRRAGRLQPADSTQRVAYQAELAALDLRCPRRGAPPCRTSWITSTTRSSDRHRARGHQLRLRRRRRRGGWNDAAETFNVTGSWSGADTRGPDREAVERQPPR